MAAGVILEFGKIGVPAPAAIVKVVVFVLLLNVITQPDILAVVGAGKVIVCDAEAIATG